MGDRRTTGYIAWFADVGREDIPAAGGQGTNPGGAGSDRGVAVQARFGWVLLHALAASGGTALRR